MAYYIFHIPSKTHPKELTKINESVYCFSSKEINIFSDFEVHQYCICLVVNAESDTKVKKAIKDFIITLNIFHQNQGAIRWFSEMFLPKHLTIDDSIENIYFQYRNPIELPIFFSFDFNEMEIHFFSLYRPKFSFIELYNKLTELPESDFIYKSLSFLAIINPITMFTHNIFDNALLENTLQFQLFETIMNEYNPESKELQSICPKCKRKNGRGINKRIEDFLNMEKFKSPEDKIAFIKSAKKVAATRHKFSHRLEGKSHTAYHEENIIPNLGSGCTIYLKEDIEYCDGTIQAVNNVKILNTVILLDKLLQK